MYLQHFQLDQPPFRITPDTRLFFSGAKRGAVLDALIYAILNGEGIIKVVGEVGSGKTMLCRMLEVRLPRQVEIVYIANPSLSPDNILQVVAHELHVVDSPTCSKLAAMQKLQEHLTRRHAEGRQVVVFVEEAQCMPLATLEEIRLLSNLETSHGKLMQLVLFGQPELDDNLAERSIRQLRERITHSFMLEPLDAEEVREYINFRLWITGYRGPELFDRRVTRQITRAAGGLIRRINILADKALLAAYADSAVRVYPKHVRNATSDCEFGPRPLLGGWRSAAALAGIGLLGAAIAWQLSQPAVETAQKPRQLAERAAPAAPQASASERTEDIATQRLAVAGSGGMGAIAGGGGGGTAHTGGDLRGWLQRSRGWLRSDSAQSFSIQLLTVDRDRNSADRLADFVADLPSNLDFANFFIYETEVDGRPVFAVLYNSYPDLRTANAAVDALPAALRRWQPFVRTVNRIRQDLDGATSGSRPAATPSSNG